MIFLSQIASACHYLHSKHIVHGNLRAACVYVESPDKVTLRLYIDWIHQIFQKYVIVYLSKCDQDFFQGRSLEMFDILAPIFPRIFQDLSKII